MNFTTFQLQVYDLLGLALPGFLAICEVWIAARGWASFWRALTALNAIAVAFLVVASYVAGHLVQEIGEISLRSVVAPRFFLRARDQFWGSAEAEFVRMAIRRECGANVEDADAGFDYCIARVGKDFPKRDYFVATADLSRSLLILFVFAVAPTSRVIFESRLGAVRSVLATVLALLSLGVGGFLVWERMIRFRALSDVSVFRAYFAKSHGRTSDGGRA